MERIDTRHGKDVDDSEVDSDQQDGRHADEIAVEDAKRTGNLTTILVDSCNVEFPCLDYPTSVERG